MKLSPAQSRALDKLRQRDPSWDSAYDLKEGMSTLDALVNLGLAERTETSNLGGLLSPSITFKYRIAKDR